MCSFSNRLNSQLSFDVEFYLWTSRDLKENPTQGRNSLIIRQTLKTQSRGRVINERQIDGRKLGMKMLKGHSGLCGFVWPTFRIVLLNSFAGNMQQLLRLILLIWWASATRACPRCVRSSLGADVFLMSWGPTAPRKAKAIKAH